MPRNARISAAAHQQALEQFLSADAPPAYVVRFSTRRRIRGRGYGGPYQL
jgi:hypothetical protein